MISSITRRWPLSLWLPGLGALCLALPALAGCITIGHEFPQSAVDLLKPGTTSVDEVQKMFGNPLRVGSDDGKLTWTFALYHASLLGDFTGHDLTVRFDAQNKVASFSFNTTDTAQPVKTK